LLTHGSKSLTRGSELLTRGSVLAARREKPHIVLLFVGAAIFGFGFALAAVMPKGGQGHERRSRGSIRQTSQ
jgi:hypothetical protein